MLKLNVFYIAGQRKVDLNSLIDSCLKKNGKIKNSSIDFIEKINDNECLCLLTKTKSFLKIIEPTKIIVCFHRLNLDLSQKDVSNFIKEIISNSVNKASFLSKEPLDTTKKDEIFSKIKSKFNNYFSYKNDLLVPDIESSEPFLNIIDLANEIFCEILVSHLLNNGNKRLAVMLVTNFLYSLGYYIKYTKSDHENWDMYSNKIADFITRYHESGSDIKLLYKETKKFILENLFLALNIKNT